MPVYDFKKLPAEMQMEILNYVPTSHLLGQCRLASKIWNENASFICRRRQVHLQGNKFYVEPAALETKFPIPGKLPWSSINLTLYSEKRAESLINEAIGVKYGYHVQKLHVVVERPNYSNLLTILSQTPNLKVLTFDSTLLSDEPTEVGALEQVLRTNKSVRQISLPKLRTLKTPWMVESFVKFLKFIITESGAKLTKLNLKLTGIRGQDLKNLLELLSTVEIKHTKMYLMFTPITEYPQFTAASSWKLFADQQFINVQKLVISLYEKNPNISPSEFRILELGLSKFRKLVKLALTGFFSSSQLTAAQLVRIPAISTLKELTYCCFSERENEHPEQDLFLRVHSLNSSDFPRLKTVQLMETSSRSKYNPMFRHLFDQNSKFASVKTFGTCQYNGNDNWADVFPNLETLIATVRFPEDVQNIFKCKHLKSLDITLETEGNSSFILSQSFKPLPTCNNLKVFSLTFDENSAANTEITITDSTALLLKLLPPVDLTLVSARITQEAEFQLRSYHTKLSFN